MDQSLGQYVFLGLVAWILYMLTFRFEQYKAINDHMRGNIKDAGNVAGKAAGVGAKVVGRLLKK